ncbi:hypothetical protein [Streptomyces eurythermus]|uniref:hypothetical protein n=1 Tax=Streptomyces eurythermus TaxID=42237 RepID=UPI003409123A
MTKHRQVSIRSAHDRLLDGEGVREHRGHARQPRPGGGRTGRSFGHRRHPLPATVESLHSIGRVPRELIPDAGPVPCRRDADGTVWLTTPEAWSKPWRHYQMADATEIDALTGLPDGEDFTQVWAWEDEAAGRVRARLRAPGIGRARTRRAAAPPCCRPGNWAAAWKCCTAATAPSFAPGP